MQNWEISPSHTEEVPLAKNGFDGEKQSPFPLITKGKGYQMALKSRAHAILNSLLGYLASNYQTSTPSTEYAQYLKAISAELARITLVLEELNTDISFETVRSEFIHQVFGYLVFVNKEVPDLNFSDEEYRNFLLKIIDIYFQGSTPKSIEDAIALFFKGNFKVNELFKQVGKPNSPYDISDQFSFVIEFDHGNTLSPEFSFLQENIELLIDLVKPAHTLYNIRHVFSDKMDPPKDGGFDPKDSPAKFKARDFRYEDFRGFCEGMAGFSSSSGYSDTDLFKISDTDVSKPLYSVSKGAALTILEGINRGVYRVTDAGSNWVQITPRLQARSDSLSYHVEIDRLGKKRENLVREDVSDQFVIDGRLIISLVCPDSVSPIDPFTVSVFVSSSLEISYAWDVIGAASFTETSPEEIVIVPGSDTWIEIRVKVSSSDGRSEIASKNVVITA